MIPSPVIGDMNAFPFVVREAEYGGDRYPDVARYAGPESGDV